MALAYSYIRWSSKKQSTGDSLARQLSYARKIASEHDLELVEMVDKGISAFRGKNASNGELGRFIDAVEIGKIPNDCWLIVENLDRISRSDVLQANELFTRLLRLGVTIVTGMDSKVYSDKSVIDNPMDLMYSIMLFMRANEESKTKSSRTVKNALNMINQHQDGERSKSGYPFAIEVVGSHPFFVDTSEGVVKPHPVYFDAARLVLTKRMEGWGTNRIKKLLDASIQPPTNKRKKLKTWSHDTIRRLPHSEQILGIRKVTLEGIEYELKDYYPKLVSDEEYQKLQYVLSKRKTNSTSRNHVGLFTGIQIGKCHHCGGSLCVYRASRSDRVVTETLRYACTNKQKGELCEQRTFAHTQIEDALIRVGMMKMWKPTDSESFDTTELDAKRNHLDDLKKQSSNLATNFALLNPVPESMVDKMREIQGSIALTESEINQLELMQAEHEHRLSDASIEQIFKALSPSILDIKNDAERIKVRELIRDSANSILLESLQGSQRAGFKMVLNWSDGSRDTVIRKGKTILLDKGHGLSEDELNQAVDAMSEWDLQFDEARNIRDFTVVSGDNVVTHRY